MFKLLVVIRDIWVLPYSHPSPHHPLPRPGAINCEEFSIFLTIFKDSSIASCLDCFSFFSLFFGGVVITEAFNISYS